MPCLNFFYLRWKKKQDFCWQYGNSLWKKVSIAPYQLKEPEANSDDEAARRVMACCLGPGNSRTTFVMLDSHGKLLDTMYVKSLGNCGQNVNDQQHKDNYQQQIIKFMTDHRPHVAVLGARNLSCQKLREDLYEIIAKMVEDNRNNVEDSLIIIYGDESLPCLYENSRIAQDQLPLFSGSVKRAVALGRYLQNPLAMVATLCGPDPSERF